MAEEEKKEESGGDGGGLSELVEQMRENNRSTLEIEKDGRNSRRHLLDMKKEQVLQTAALNQIANAEFVINPPEEKPEKEDTEGDREDKKLQQAIDLLSQTSKNNKILHKATIDNIIDIIQQYSKAWDILLKYDEDRLEIPEMDGTNMKTLSISEIRASIASFKRELCKVNQATDLFGQEKDNQLDAIIPALDQTFDGISLYKSIEERAANLLYLVIKDHPFLDGNKRIGSFLFTSYLSQSGKKSLNPQSLVALALLIAESNPKQKDLMIQLIINLIVKF